MRTRLRGCIALAALLTVAVTGHAFAAGPAWQPQETVASVRGFTTPDVGIDRLGRAAVVFTSGNTDAAPRVHLALRDPGGPFVPAGPQGGGEADPQVVVNPDGAVAILSTSARKLHVSILPAPVGRGFTDLGRPAHHMEVALAGELVEMPSPEIGIDGLGRATVAWATRIEGAAYGEMEVHAVTASADGLGPVESLGRGYTCFPRLDVNSRGDAVILGCLERRSALYHRAAGGTFGPPEAIPELPPIGWVYDGPGHPDVRIDGRGTAVVWQSYNETGGAKWSTAHYRTQYALRPPSGPIGPARELAPAAGPVAAYASMEAQQDGRLVAAWPVPDGVAYAVGSTDGGFGATSATIAAAEAIASPAVEAASSGPAMVHWSDPVRKGPAGWSQVRVALIGTDGVASEATPVGLIARSRARAVARFAINEGGSAIGAWEHGCPDDTGTVGAVLREPGRVSAAPPCLDARTPRASIPTRSARLVGRTLRVRMACDEWCFFNLRARVLRQGRRKPLATVALPRERSAAAMRRTLLKLRLSRAQARRVRASLRVGGLVRLRLSVALRDVYENGTRRRLQVRVR